MLWELFYSLLKNLFLLIEGFYLRLKLLDMLSYLDRNLLFLFLCLDIFINFMNSLRNFLFMGVLLFIHLFKLFALLPIFSFVNIFHFFNNFTNNPLQIPPKSSSHPIYYLPHLIHFLLNISQLPNYSTHKILQSIIFLNSLTQLLTNKCM